jgi:hypothetical protein
VAVNTVRSPQREKTGDSKTIFSMVENRLNLNKLFEDGIPVKYIPRVLYLAIILIFYIGNTHYSERIVRRIDRLKKDVENIRADYTTMKADLMFSSKASEVAKKVAPMGLQESLTPPTKIIVKEGEY